MNRRELIGTFGLGTLAAVGGVKAQAPQKIFRFGIVGLSAGADLAGSDPRHPPNVHFCVGCGS